MKRYRLFLVIYLLSLIIFIFNSLGTATQRFSRKESTHTTMSPSTGMVREYWFSVRFDGRFWMVDKDARIYDLHSPEDLSFPVVVTNAKVDPEKGIVEGVKGVLPDKIPEFVFEINFEKKYLTLDNSAVVKILSLVDLRSCIKVLEVTHQYLNPKVLYLFNNGKLYKIG
ncbi:DUF4894 domain-containing protein [Fervidobacterium thailandense]|uniref:DUF4894 domain-containing protein n=1 Tax=Fervidobacterium thailandense TaxID=1008305 RepID=A0A1E3G326_9BACT|nr:DUF4894 domain-containing protein [Fervidobacterium thailandense]ODN30233.1 hypothetical protein A4H02_06645 [Fervidobacterium thailandense]